MSFAQRLASLIGYQYLRAHKKADGFLDQEGMAAFISRSSLASKNE
ncbi:DNA-binding protein [Vibrio vulnificus]|nr:DNA-binding protein [Vibrio vulnificus]